MSVRVVKFNPSPIPMYSGEPDAVLTYGDETYKIYLKCYHKYRWGYGLVKSSPREVCAWDRFWEANTGKDALDRALHDAVLPDELRTRRYSNTAADWEGK